MATTDKSVIDAYDALRSAVQDAPSSSMEGMPPPPVALKGEVQKKSTFMLIPTREKVFMSIESGTLVYFEPEHWYIVGRHCLLGAKVFRKKNCKNDDRSVRILLRDSTELVFYAEKAKHRSRWEMAVNRHIEYAHTFNEWKKEFIPSQDLSRQTVCPTSAVVANDLCEPSDQRECSKDHGAVAKSVPVVCRGWLFKKGQILPTIRKRYFELQLGVIRYYTEDLTDPLKSREAVLQGEMPICGYNIYSSTSHGMLKITLFPGVQTPKKYTRKLELYCEDYAEKAMWIRAFNVHTSYGVPDLNSFSFTSSKSGSD